MIICCYVLGVTGLLTSIITGFFISTIFLMTCCQFLKTVSNLPQIENEHFTLCEKL